MPSWSIFRKKPKKKNRVRWDLSSVSDHHDSDSESQNSSIPSELELKTGGSVSSEPDHHYLHDSEDEEEKQMLSQLERLGMVLENVFKEVETIDASVFKMREDFDHDMMTEQRFMSCMCSAKIARAACCKKQIEVWQKVQHNIWEFCCHHHHLHEEMNSHRLHSVDDLSLADSDTCSISSHDDDVDCTVHLLQKSHFFDLIRQRLDPRADPRSFVEHWVLQTHGQHSNH